MGAVVTAAGRGRRFGSPENKIWSEIGGRSLLDWTLSAFQSHPAIHEIAVVGTADELERVRATAARYGKVRHVVAGGDTRQDSVGRGLRALSAACEIVLVHDAVRPAISAELISRVVEAVAHGGAAVPGLPVSDTLKRVDKEGRVVETVPRNDLWSVQTPQGARLADLLAAYETLGERVGALTDEASVLEAAGYPVRIVEGDSKNLKVTLPGDLERAAQALGVPGASADAVARQETIRTGFGYDVHAFAEGRELWLGGVRIPHARGLAGHSDADVVLHAVCDALLGAAGMGDIGLLFPDTDARHRDRPSVEFVREVRARLRESGWQIVNVDATLLAEEPRIGPYRERMAALLAGELGIAPAQVNIKATTSERMGFVGRREGVACWAVATISAFE